MAERKMNYTALYLVLEKWEELMNRAMRYEEERDNRFNVVIVMYQIEAVYEQLKYLMPFLDVLESSTYEGSKVNDLLSQITLVADQAYEIINSFMELRPLTSIMYEIRSIKSEVEVIYHQNAYMIGDTQYRAVVSPHVASRLDIWRHVIGYKTHHRFFMVNWYEVQSVYDDIQSLKDFIERRKITADEQARVESLVDSIVRKASDADCILLFFKRRRHFGNILKSINSITAEVRRISEIFHSRRDPQPQAAQAARRWRWQDHKFGKFIVRSACWRGQLAAKDPWARRLATAATSVVFGNGSSGVDFLLANLKQLINHEKDEYNLFTQAEMEQTESMYQEFGSLRTFLIDVEMIRHHHQTLQDLVNHIIDLAYEAQDITYSLVCDDVYPDSSHRNLGNVLKEIKSIKIAVAEIYKKKLYGVGDPLLNVVPSNNNTSRSSTAGDSIANEETIVGFDSEVETIRDRLAGGSNQLDVISIVGMAGLGKTTLAKKLYNDPYIVYHFYIRGWTYVSQVYRGRDLFLAILTCFVENKDELYTMDNGKLAEELHKRLKGQKYLIVMDDVWDVRPWNDLRRCFPNDNNGSRVILTSRHTNVAVQVKSKSPPHPLRFLTEEESWCLFEQKVFQKESCPPYLVEKGREIVQKCGGLPLAIVVIAGLLSKTDKVLDWWRQVAGCVSSHIASDPEQCIDTLALSYNHLPHHLKLCFLYFGAFPEDNEIRVTKLICLWIAEGFIHPIGQRTFEDVAEEYLMDLIDRSLVLVSKKKSTWGIKSCRVHDMLRDLCLRKAKEENFLEHISGKEVNSSFTNINMLSYASCSQIEKEANSLHDKDASSSFSSDVAPNRKKKHRVCIDSSTLYCISSLNPPASHIRSLFCIGSEMSSASPINISWPATAFRLLKVLDLSAINISDLPLEILTLVLLRYLALQGKQLSLPVSISNLCNLETLMVSKARSGSIPPNIWKMVNLRHLRIGGENDIEFPEHRDNRDFPSILYNLQTISQVCPSSSLENVLARTLNLRKLVLCVNSSSGQRLLSLRLDFLNQLEVLHLLNRDRHGQLNSFEGFSFPPNLKRITLSNTGLQWKEMSILKMLPNLEALKLEYEACVGPRWDTGDGGFRRLKYLRMHYMKIQKWNASSIHFPNLQHLVLSRCKELEEIPSDLGNIPTLDTVEVSWCSYSAVESASQIQEEQQSLGNDSLKILTNHPEWEDQ